ncbi:unnamed protein product [Closterium sp. NIES-54]
MAKRAAVSGAGAGDPRAGGAGAGGARGGGTGAGGTVQWRPFFVPPPPSSLPPLDSVLLQPDSPLPALSPYVEQTDSLTERREPESRPASLVRAVQTGRCVPCPRPPLDPSIHIMALTRSLPPLPPSPAPPCLPCTEGRQHAAPHSSSFPPMTAPLQTLHMDVWGPACVSGQGRERYFLLVVDDYKRYTTVFPLRNKGEVPNRWSVLPRPHARRISSTSGPVSPCKRHRLHYVGQGRLAMRQCFGSGALVPLAFVSADKLSSHAICCVFLGFPPDVLGWRFYHPTMRGVLPSQDVTFDVSVPFYHLIPYCTAPLPPPPLFLAPGPPLVDPLPPQGPAPSGVSQVDPLPLAEPIEVTVDSCAAGGGAARGAASGGAEPAGAEPGVVEPVSAEPGGAESEGAEPGGAESEGAESGGAGDVSAGCVAAGGVSAGGVTAGGVCAGGDFAGGVAPGIGAAGGVIAGGSACLLAGRLAGRVQSRACSGGAVASRSIPATPFTAAAKSTGGRAGTERDGTKRGLALMLRGAELEGTESGGVEPEGTESGCAEPRGTASAGGPTGALPGQSRRREPLSPRQLRKWFARRTRLWSGSTGVGGPAAGGSGAKGARATSPGGVGGTAGAGSDGAGGSGGAGAAGSRGARTGGTGAANAGGAAGARGAGARGAGAGGTGAEDAGSGDARAGGTGAGGTGAGGAGAGDPGASGAGARGLVAGGAGAGGAGAGGTGAGGTVQRRPFFVPPPPSSLPPLGSPDSPLPAPSPYTEQTYSLTECREPASRPALPVRAVRTGPGVPRPLPVPGTHTMALRPSSVPLRVPLPSPPASSLPDGPEPDPLLLVAELVDFAVACRLDYAASLVAKSASDCPPSVGGECALCTDVLEDRQEDFECLAAAVPHLVAMLLAPEGDLDAPDIPTPRSYVEAITDEFVEPSGPYPELVGCLKYPMTCTRPVLAYPLSILASYVAPGRHQVEHWEAAIRVLRYLCSTSGMGLVLGGQGPVSEGLGFESQCVHFGHPSAGGCQRSTGDPRLILGKGYRHVGLGGYGRTHPLLNKPFYPNDCKAKVESFWEFVRQMRSLHDYPLDLIVNTDQTPLFLEMPAEQTIEMKGVRTVHVRRVGYEKERVTVMLACMASGIKLPPYMVFKRKTISKVPIPASKHTSALLPLLLLAAATAALLASTAQCCPTLPRRHQRCPAAATAAGHCRCCYWSLPLLPCLHALLSAALPCLAAAIASLLPPLLPATAAAATGHYHCCPACMHCSALPYPAWPPPALPCCRHCCRPLPLLLLAAATAAASRCHCCPGCTHCPALPCPAWPPLVLPCTLPSAALPCLAATSTAMHAAQHCQAAAAVCCCCTSPNRCTTNTASPAPRATCTRAPSYSRSSLATPSLLLLAATDYHGHYHCPTSAAAKCAGVSLAAAASRRREWAVRWGATTGGTCESTPAGSAASRRGGSRGGQQQQQRPLETLSLQQLCEWAVRWGSPGGGGFRGTRTGGVEAPGGVEATSLGACDSASAGAELEEALHTFTLDSGTSRCFFRDSTTVTSLTAPVPVTLADPSGGLVVARGATVLPSSAAPSGLPTGLHLPSFAKNLVATSVLQDLWVTITQPGGELVTICTDSRTGEHLATFTQRPRSGLYTLTTESTLADESGQVAASVEFVASCSCRLLTHQTLLWHHHAFVACTLVLLSLGFLGPCPRSRGRLRRRAFLASRGGSAPLLTPRFLRPQLLCRPPHGRIRAVRRQLRARFQQDLPVLRLHSDRGGEFSSDLPEEFCSAERIRQTFTLPASSHQNGIAERRIGSVMEVACTSIVHAAAPHFLWPFAVRYAAEQLNLWPFASHPATSPTLRWTGEVGDASPFRVWGALLLVRDPPTGKLSPRTLRCVFLGFPTDAPGWQFYHPGSRRVLSSQDVTFDESVCFYHLHPHRSSPVPLPRLAPVDPSPLDEPVEVSSDTSGPAEGDDPTPAATMTPRRSARLAVPPGFPPRLSSLPLQPVAVDSGVVGGGNTGGGECPLGTGGTGGNGAGGPGTTGGIAPSYGYFKYTPDRISVTPLLVGRHDILTWKEAIEPQLEMAGLIGFARGTVATPEKHYLDLREEFRAMQLPTFTIISRCFSPGVQIALKSCKEYLDVGHRAWHFIESMYQVTDALYIGQLEEQLSHIWMGVEETATNYCNRARRILATMRMAGVQYSTASYLTHVIKGLTSSYNLLKRLSLAPSTRATLNEDSLTLYIQQDEVMQEAGRPSEPLAQVNYVTPVKQGG